MRYKHLSTIGLCRYVKLQYYEGETYSAWALKEVDEAPMSLFASVDVLDLSSRGEAVFASALEGYDRKVDAIEEHLARLLTVERQVIILSGIKHRYLWLFRRSV